MKLQFPFLQLPVSFDAQALADEISRIGEEHWRPHPNGLPGNTALTLVTTGGNPDSNELLGPMKPTKWLEQCPYLTQVLDALGCTWGRSRLMRLSGQAEVNPHVDLNYYWRDRMRVHVPIVTTPSVRFQCGDAEVHMAAGESWIFDTWRRHRVINGGSESRIHLVADTVGGERFWKLAANGRTHDRQVQGWVPRHVAPIAGVLPSLDYESTNVPVVMTPWEVKANAGFLIGETPPSQELAQVQQILLSFTRDWHALWACHGESNEGWPRYRRLLDGARDAVSRAGAGRLAMRNGSSLMSALSAHIFDVALGEKAAARQDAFGRVNAGVTLA